MTEITASKNKKTALSVAKKSIKKQQGGDNNTMKLKELAKLVVQTLNNHDGNNGDNSNTTTLSTKQVKEWLANSDKFQVDGKRVRLVSKKEKKKDKKRKQRQQEEEDEGRASSSSSPSDVISEELESLQSTAKTRDDHDAKTDDEAAAEERRPHKKTKTTATTTALVDSDDEWRTTNKIVIVKPDRMPDAGDACLVPYRTFQDDNKKSKKKKSRSSSDDITADSSSATMNAALIRQCVVGNGFTTPSPIQAQAWPILTHDRDMVGIAETGSGKTLAFALPILSKIVNEKKKLGASQSYNNKKKKNRPRMLVLSPTRELAMQSNDVLTEFGNVVGLQSLVIYGGVPKYPQTTELKRGNVDCVVATPGRLKDLINEGSCDLSEVNYLVLDEADRMIDVGFEEDVRYIIAQCRSKHDQRQTCMFSATWPVAIQKIAAEFMNDPIRVYVGFDTVLKTTSDSDGDESGENTATVHGVDDSLSANKRVEQNVEVIEDRQREGRLRDLLRQVMKTTTPGQQQKPRVLVFALYKKEAERLEYTLNRDEMFHRVGVCSIHGNKNQVARTAALKQFKDGSCPIMVATDVAARGLDIPNVHAVINYTFPLTIEDYIHRIGRTGRAGKTGISYTFFQGACDKAHAGALQNVIRQAGQTVPAELMKFGSTIKKKEHKLYGNFGPSSSGIPMKKATRIVF